MAKKQKKQSNNNEYPIVFNLEPAVGCGERDLSYELWSIITKCVTKERVTKVEVGIWSAYVLANIVEGISLKNQVTIFRTVDCEDGVALAFNPECGTKIKFDGRELIDLIPYDAEIALTNMLSLSGVLNKNNINSPTKINLQPRVGLGIKSVSYTLWEHILSRIVRLNTTEVEVGLWGAYTLGHTIDGISLAEPIVIAKNGLGNDVMLKFNPSCGKMIRFDGTDLIELLPGEMEEVIIR